MIWTDTERKLQDFFEDGRPAGGTLGGPGAITMKPGTNFSCTATANICEITYIYEGEGLYRQGKEVYPVKAGGYSSV